MHLLTPSSITTLGVFLLGASAGSLLRYIQDRAIINHYKQELERASLLSDIGESLLTDMHKEHFSGSEELAERVKRPDQPSRISDFRADQ